MEVVKNYTDSELLEALRSGRGMNPVLKFLYRQNFEVLKVYVIQNSGSEKDAEDIFQEVLVSFIELVRLEKFRGDSSVKTFLYALTRNTWLNELKRKGRADVREMKFEKAKDTIDEDAAQKIAGRESRKQVMDVVEKLGEQCKKILLAYYYEDRSMKEIVDIAGYDSEQVVRNKKYKCLKQLEQMLTADPNMAKTLKKALNYE